MNQTAKLTVLASLLAASALAAGCVPSLNYGSVPPEPKYTTKVTTTTATGATTRPFTTPKPRTGTISWEELNGPMERSTRAKATEAVVVTGGFGAVGEAAVGAGRGSRLKSADEDNDSGGNVQTAVQGDVSPAAAEAPVQGGGAAQTAAPQTEPPLQQVEGPPPQQEYQPSPAELVPTPQPDPPPAEQPDIFWE